MSKQSTVPAVAAAVKAGVTGAALAAGTTPPKAPAVALRGGQAVAMVVPVAGAVYHTKAPHNLAWWATITKATEGGKAAAVANLCTPTPKGLGVPTHFVGYCIRRGYLAAA